MATVVLNATSLVSFIDSANPDTNPGDSGSYTLGERNDQTNQKKRPLMYFPITQNIPAGSTLSSVVFSIYANLDRSDNARTARVYRVKRAVDLASVTWNVYSTGNAWQTAGGTGANDIDTTEIGTRNFTATETLNQYKDFTLTTAAIQEMIDGTFTNNGFLIKMDTESDDAYLFDTGGANQAILTISYTPPPVAGGYAFFM